MRNRLYLILCAVVALCSCSATSSGGSPVVSRARAGDAFALWYDGNVLVVYALVDADAELLWRNVPDPVEPGDWAPMFPTKAVSAGWIGAWQREPSEHVEVEPGGELPPWARVAIPDVDVARFALKFGGAS
jgi:hypothetical protein